MKHTAIITLILIGLFLGAQLMGLVILNKYNNKELPFNIKRPEFRQETSSISLLLTILIVTVFAFLLIRLRARKVWMIWFFLSVFFTLVIAFSVFFNQYLALVIALVLAFLKTLRNNVYLHNFTELFIYGGLASIFVPVLSIVSMIVILIIISIYDFIAVFKTKHMIKMAKFQTKIKLFAGLFVPYGNKTAILGGGDLGFPLLFSGVLFRTYGWFALISVLTSTIALAFLLWKSEKNKYYPAMPTISIGCLVGYGIIMLVL